MIRLMKKLAQVLSRKKLARSAYCVPIGNGDGR